MADEPTTRWLSNTDDIEGLRLVEVELPGPATGEVVIDVRAAGMNPVDFKRLGLTDAGEPAPVGFEVSGVLHALGPDTEIASGGGAPGDEVLAFRIVGGYASRLIVPAADVFAKPTGLSHPAAANLLLAATTAAEMLEVTGVLAGDTIVLHGASGAVGVSVLQQARALGARVVGTASPDRFEVVSGFVGTPVAYGEGLSERLRDLAPDGGYAAALDAVGTDEALDASLALVTDRDRIVTISAFERGRAAGVKVIGGSLPASAEFRDRARAGLIKLAGAGELVVPVARTYPLAQAREALEFLRAGHPGGKLALVS